MNPFSAFALAARRHQLRKMNEWIRCLEDQELSARQALVFYRERRAKLEGQIALLETPRAIIRRVGA